MKRNLLTATLLSTALMLSACTADTTEETVATTASQDTAEKLSIVASSFYQYDWLCEILGEEQGNFELTLLMDNGTDLHSYEPSVADIATISSADLFLYTGGESDTWVNDIIAQALNEDLVSLNMSEILVDRVLTEVAVEGMQETEHSHSHDDEDEDDDHDHDEEDADDHDHDEEDADDHDHDDEDADHDHDDEDADHDHDEEDADDHDHDAEEEADDHDHDDAEEADDHDHDDAEEADDHDHEEEAEQDEHVWLSLENAMIICDILADQLGELDAEHAEEYRTNADAYIASLAALSSQYQTMVSEAPRDTVLFGDRFPFLYLMNDYGVEYYAAFQGCSAETEASFETILFLTEKVNELGLNYVLIIDNGLEELATTIIANSQNPNCEILVLDSMQSTSSIDIDAGVTYYSIMEENLAVLALALGE